MQIWSVEIKEIESLDASIKGRFPELEKELEHLIKTEDENVACFTQEDAWRSLSLTSANLN